ncbi:MAG: outer membrane protein assembly factor BamE [Pseudomonadota bacterium]|nr:outer membrane protein assembly factor BamE [Pseudomonadota bacterium]
MKPNFRLCTIAALTAMMITACTPVINTRGNLIETERLERIETGVSSRADVTVALGSPTTRSAYPPEVWYYVGETRKIVAFHAPKVIERKVVAVDFDETGRVADIRTLTCADGRIIDPTARETETGGRDMTILQQLFGNLGRVPVGGSPAQMPGQRM